MAESPLLKTEFSNCRYQESRVEGGNWSGFYLYGALSYLEFTDHIAVPGLEVEPGDGMVAFNAETAGSVDWIIARMGERYPESNPSPNLRHMKMGDDRIPYSHTATFKYEGGHEGFGAWVMEYHHDFKHRVTRGRAKPGDISRRKGGPERRHHPDKYFKDVVGVTAAVSETRRANLVNLLTELGYEIEERAGRTLCRGAGNVVELVPKVDEEYTITQIRVSLTRPKKGERAYRFGPDAVLVFGDSLEAVWEFGGSRE